MRPNCECCDRDLSPGDAHVYICSFECTWCPACVDGFENRACPNCGGSLTLRPTRSPEKLADNPASTVRVLAEDCVATR
ncbi:DUF1272 domain-containing protein [Conyzicola lurida]|uniref:DUF1272 domain-containing protein n=1 Tax=Conyzicola lurida TaxID=1172621 RepID=UPI001C86709B|nr:DUF1272 domain-containing protein [Conyzicola lurida]